MGVLAAEVSGSSPLTRGAPLRSTGRVERKGLIPAHAGSTTRFVPLRLRQRAHPRSRGEHLWLHSVVCRYEGSSPLTRGALPSMNQKGGWLGLIPAHAGSTPFRGPSGLVLTAHPRSRGEHRFAAASKTSSTGSSPLTRGAPLLNSELRSPGLSLHTTSQRQGIGCVPVLSISLSASDRQNGSVALATNQFCSAQSCVQEKGGP